MVRRAKWSVVLGALGIFVACGGQSPRRASGQFAEVSCEVPPGLLVSAETDAVWLMTGCAEPASPSRSLYVPHSTGLIEVIYVDDRPFWDDIGPFSGAIVGTVSLLVLHPSYGTAEIVERVCRDEPADHVAWHAPDGRWLVEPCHEMVRRDRRLVWEACESGPGVVCTRSLVGSVWMEYTDSEWLPGRMTVGGAMLGGLERMRLSVEYLPPGGLF